MFHYAGKFFRSKVQNNYDFLGIENAFNSLIMPSVNHFVRLNTLTNAYFTFQQILLSPRR